MAAYGMPRSAVQTALVEGSLLPALIVLDLKGTLAWKGTVRSLNLTGQTCLLWKFLNSPRTRFH